MFLKAALYFSPARAEGKNRTPKTIMFYKQSIHSIKTMLYTKIYLINKEINAMLNALVVHIDFKLCFNR